MRPQWYGRYPMIEAELMPQHPILYWHVFVTFIAIVIKYRPRNNWKEERFIWAHCLTAHEEGTSFLVTGAGYPSSHICGSRESTQCWCSWLTPFPFISLSVGPQLMKYYTHIEGRSSSLRQLPLQMSSQTHLETWHTNTIGINPIHFIVKCSHHRPYKELSCWCRAIPWSWRKEEAAVFVHYRGHTLILPDILMVQRLEKKFSGISTCLSS